MKEDAKKKTDETEFFASSSALSRLRIRIEFNVRRATEYPCLIAISR